MCFSNRIWLVSGFKSLFSCKQPKKKYNAISGMTRDTSFGNLQSVTATGVTRVTDHARVKNLINDKWKCIWCYLQMKDWCTAEGVIKLWGELHRAWRILPIQWITYGSGLSVAFSGIVQTFLLIHTMVQGIPHWKVSEENTIERLLKTTCIILGCHIQ